MALTADTIVYGNIYTVDKNQPSAQAAAIAAIGEKSSDKGVKDLAYIASKELSK